MEIDELDAAATLARAHDAVISRRRAQVEELQLAAHWCDLHPVLPLTPSGHVATTPHGCPALIRIGGDGTPEVVDVSLCELGVAREASTLATRNLAADALDLLHRLPRTWAKVQTLSCEPWVARKAASLSRHLSPGAVGIVDAAVADAICGQPGPRVVELAQAKVIEADPEGHEQRLAEQAALRFVGLGRINADGMRHLIARVTAGDAAAIDATVDLVADILAADPVAHDLPADASRGLLRSVALGWLARPVDLLTLLLGKPQSEPTDAAECQPTEATEAAWDDRDSHDVEPEESATSQDTAEPADESVSLAELRQALADLDQDKLRATAVVYLHLTCDAVHEGRGVARVEGLGPHSLAQVQALLRHRRVVVKPVIDLRDRVSTAAYEYPESIRERVHLLHLGDAFPHATATSRNPRHVDIDHALGWTRDGPPDQTCSHTGQPLSRTPHRAKTFLGYRSIPMPTGETLWRTPHGQYRIVDAAGTHVIDRATYDAWTGPSPAERALARLMHRNHTGQFGLGST